MRRQQIADPGNAGKRALFELAVAEHGFHRLRHLLPCARLDPRGDAAVGDDLAIFGSVTWKYRMPSTASWVLSRVMQTWLGTSSGISFSECL
ncbi:MAG: hypothetical protein M1449_05580 [Candidatus Thermoplasmatota archaeon]|nr:hypothetical protein [Candidatus Thermoplasmatota archaeon]